MAIALAVLPGTAAGAAPGACPQPVLDRYDPGDEVTIVGYTGGCLPALDQRPSATGDALYAYLYPDTSPRDSRLRPDDPRAGIALGQFSVADAARSSLGRRMSLTFTLPPATAPGVYYVEICEGPCSTLLQPDPNLAIATHGWPSWPIVVGVDPPSGPRPVHLWPPDDPAVQYLPDDAFVLDSDGDRTTMGDLRSPRVGAENVDPERTERVTTGPEDDSPADGRPRLVFWGIAAALVAVAWGIVARASRSRKRIRR
ncbi:MAG TPA: hypothetical protein VH479_04295 [Acidimicrobiales bacterium]